MKRYVPWIGVLFLVVSPLRAEPTPAPQPVKETWDAVYIEGAKAGYFHTTVREIERDGKKLLADTQVMRLGVKREGKVRDAARRDRRRGDAGRQGRRRVDDAVRRGTAS